MFVELMDKRKKNFTRLRAEEQRRKPPTKAQKRSMDTELVKESSKKAEMVQESSFNRAREELGSDNSKKQKLDDSVEVEVDDEAEMKKHMEIVFDDEGRIVEIKRLHDHLGVNIAKCADRIIQRCVAGEEAAQVLTMHNTANQPETSLVASPPPQEKFSRPGFTGHISFAMHVLLFNSRLRLFPGKLKSRWYRPFSVSRDMKNGAIELYDEEGSEFIVNKQRVKPYQKNILDTNKDDDVTLEDEGEVT
ncbi:hypothetical protein Tco_0817997 [Tanacetum coccineum]